MSRLILICVTILGFAGCTAPQGQKLTADATRIPTRTVTEPAASPAGPAPVATGPASATAALGLQNQGEIVRLNPNGTITVTLPAAYRRGYTWRFAEIPDPTVLKLVSKDFIPGESPAKPGEQTMVFQATGLGDVPVKLRYGSLWATSDMSAIKPYEFIASVAPEEVKPVKSSKKKKAAR